MKRPGSSQAAQATRVALAAILAAAGLLLVVVSTPAKPVSQDFSGTYDPNVYPCATPRHHSSVPDGQTRIVVQVITPLPTNDITLTLLYGPDPSPVLIHTEDTASFLPASVRCRFARPATLSLNSHADLHWDVHLRQYGRLNRLPRQLYSGVADAPTLRRANVGYGNFEPPVS